MAQPVSPVLPNFDLSQKFEITFAKDQPEYLPVPAVYTDKDTIITRWELTNEEIQTIIKTKSIFLEVMTFGKPLQPLLIRTDEPEIIKMPRDDDPNNENIEVTSE